MGQYGAVTRNPPFMEWLGGSKCLTPGANLLPFRPLKGLEKSRPQHNLLQLFKLSITLYSNKMASGIPAQLFSGIKSKEPNLNDSPATYRMEARTLSTSNTNLLLQGGWTTSTHLFSWLYCRF